MKITVIAGTGLIGSQLVERLRKRRQEVVAASPSSGVNTLKGEGLTDALKKASAAIAVHLVHRALARLSGAGQASFF